MVQQLVRRQAPKRRRRPAPFSRDADANRAAARLGAAADDDAALDELDAEGDYERSVEDIAHRRERLQEQGIY